MHARLGAGAWVVASRGAVHLGILVGDLGSGWHSRVGIIEPEALGPLVDHLNTGRAWAGRGVSVESVGGGATLTIGDGPSVVLDEQGAARLQVFCTHVRLGISPSDEWPPIASALTCPRGRVEVHDVWATSAPLGTGTAVAGRYGSVAIDVVTASGPLRFGLPALQVLVAASEAERDGDPLRIAVRALGGSEHVVIIPAADAAQVAAEAQWLMPAFWRAADEGHHTPRT